MSAVNRSEDPEPSQPVPAGLLHIPVRSGRAGCTVRFFRTLPGGRTAAGFTSAAKLTAALGVNQESIRLSDPALRALAGPLGVFTLIVDPRFSARPEVLVGAGRALSSHVQAADAPAGAREDANIRRGAQVPFVQIVDAPGTTGAVPTLAHLNLLNG
ncbi:SAV_915 family protein [Streptomyces sp. NPDC002688]|uniref:SAV_915 family protein n=1 Tax=Streptomyces sp. NPDC002688 TaxID=3154423 RepID=UPI003325EE4E